MPRFVGGNSALALPDRLPVALIVAQRRQFGKIAHSPSRPVLSVSVESVASAGCRERISWPGKVRSQHSPRDASDSGCKEIALQSELLGRLSMFCLERLWTSHCPDAIPRDRSQAQGDSSAGILHEMQKKG